MDVNNLGHLPNMSNCYLIERAVRELDPLTMWNLVSEKVLNHFKIWDLLKHKVFQYNANQQITDEGVQHLASEVDLIFKELKQFLKVRCDNKTRKSFLSSGYLDQNLARLISINAFAAPGQSPPSNELRNMPYQYEGANQQPSATNPMVASANVKAVYGAKQDSNFVTQQPQPQMSHQFNSQQGAPNIIYQAPNNTTSSGTPSQPQLPQVIQMTQQPWVTPADLPNITEAESGEEAIMKKWREKMKKKGLPIYFTPCTNCIQCKTCNNIRIRVEYAEHFPISQEEYKEAISKGTPYRCAKCHIEFLTKQGFVAHLNSKCTGMVLPKPKWKKINNRYTCDVENCPSILQGRSWCTTTGVWAHHYAEHEHFTNLPYMCDACPKSFPTKTLLSNHRQDKHVVHEKQPPCRFCGKLFTSRSVLRVHERGHTGEKPFKCGSCNFRATSKKRVQAHKKRQHDDLPRNEVCHTCGKGFLLRYQLKEHCKTHADETSHPCQLCGQVLKNLNSHKKHMISAHQLGFSCDLCSGYTYTTEQGLVKHMVDKHGVQKNPEMLLDLHKNIDPIAIEIVKELTEENWMKQD